MTPEMMKLLHFLLCELIHLCHGQTHSVLHLLPLALGSMYCHAVMAGLGLLQVESLVKQLKFAFAEVKNTISALNPITHGGAHKDPGWI